MDSRCLNPALVLAGWPHRYLCHLLFIGNWSRSAIDSALVAADGFAATGLVELESSFYSFRDCPSPLCFPSSGICWGHEAQCRASRRAEAISSSSGQDSRIAKVCCREGVTGSDQRGQGQAPCLGQGCSCFGRLYSSDGVP